MPNLRASISTHMTIKELFESIRRKVNIILMSCDLICDSLDARGHKEHLGIVDEAGWPPVCMQLSLSIA